MIFVWWTDQLVLLRRQIRYFIAVSLSVSNSCSNIQPANLLDPCFIPVPLLFLPAMEKLQEWLDIWEWFSQLVSDLSILGSTDEGKDQVNKQLDKFKEHHNRNSKVKTESSSQSAKQRLKLVKKKVSSAEIGTLLNLQCTLGPALEWPHSLFGSRFQPWIKFSKKHWPFKR